MSGFIIIIIIILFKHRALKNRNVSQLHPLYKKRKGISRLTRTILRSTPTWDIDNVLSMIRISKDNVVIITIFVVIVVGIRALIVEAYFFIGFDILSGKYGEEGLLDITFIDVACIQTTVGVARMILPDESVVKGGRNLQL